MASTPRDRFDNIPRDLVRVGAHRAPAKRGRGWIAFAWAALATGLLVVAGLYGLSLVNPAISFEIPELGGAGDQPSASPTPKPEVTPLTDPTLVDPALELSISVLNASPTEGAQQTAGDEIALAGWPTPAVALAGARDVETTMIYYNGSDYEAIAAGLAQLLGTDVTQIRNSDFYLGAKVTIVLGADYAPAAP